MTDFANGSAGAAVRIGGIGTVTAGIAASVYRDRVESKFQVDAEARILGIDLYAGIERAENGYNDVVRRIDARARLGRGNTPGQNFPVPSSGSAGDPLTLAFASETDRAGASFTVLDTGISLNYTRLRLPGEHLRIASASVYRTLFGRVSAWANGFKEYGDRDDYGVYVGFSLLLGKGINASANYSRSNEDAAVSARVWHDPEETEGAWGWSLNATEPVSGDTASFRSASVRYLARFATFEATVEQRRGDLRGTAFVEGSIVAMDGLFFAPLIDESFAIVSGAGANTPVLSNTRRVTRTDSHGRALVPYLSSYQENVVSIDPSELAVDLRPARTEAVVIPGDRAGVIVDFGVERIAAAVVILVDAAGTPLPVGSVVLLEGAEEQAVVGFDGRTYLTGLASQNRITVRLEDASECTASFAFAPVEGEQVQIGPLTCQ
jgi:outer membrane usher protein